MNKINHELIKQSFSKQASSFPDSPVLGDVRQIEAIVDMAGIQEGEWVLDLGCGTGLITRALARRSSQVVGLDLTLQMLEKAKEQGDKQGLAPLYVQGDACQTPFISEMFDCVVTRLTLHHMTEPERLIWEIKRVLKPSGRLILADIIADADPEKQKRHNQLEQLRDPSHVKFLTEQEIEELLLTTGFSLISTKRWETNRTLAEWLAVTGSDKQHDIVKMMEEGMEEDAFGLQIRYEMNDIVFTHHWYSVQTVKSK
ncbi:ubiquinone/menaquinone biosynthesis C-methylase UbiE [Caldalkalibacillus uzonensis]|uniref:Ubiquinone/menaquinone biosynthesis C-methylase UbiE n=1 Tax=Caldalkalibacillus uzonensis TaxID=353224 RepID=A0ABU0CQN6_9BACI|nr:class I SAM-dependent methyltransferase [Caldalkalibacillus uzonensis]MDQ0338206.1 ubiquinone/menaquinone biosynthesis C-methylase UbiE [Caldalkalibacillus uzonensis]